MFYNFQSLNMKVAFFDKLLENQIFFDDIILESHHICNWRSAYGVNYAQKLIFLGEHTCAHCRDLHEALDWGKLEQMNLVPAAKLCRVS